MVENQEQFLKMKGILGKESPALFGGYQNRFFQIVHSTNSYLLTYSDKEGSQVKGAINFSDITSIQSASKKELLIVTNERKFKLKAENESLKNKWIEALNYTKNESVVNKKEVKENFDKVSDNSSSKGGKSWKVENLSKEVVNALSKKGISLEKSKEFSEKCLDLKGLRTQLRAINPQALKYRCKYGFMQKSHKSNSMLSQKRWLFLISARPLSINDQLIDEETYNDSYLPSTLKFDTLYYYGAEDDQDISSFKKELPMYECSRIETKENDKEYYLIIDMNERIYEFITDVCWERDYWYEALLNSRKTSKDIMNSKTKKPRNILKLTHFYNSEGESKIEKIADSEVENIVKDFDSIEDHNVLEALIKKLNTVLTQTIDGCNLCTPPQLEVLRIYTDSFTCGILQKIQSYWSANYESFEDKKILELISSLHRQEARLFDFGVHDPNFGFNNSELIAFFTRRAIKLIQPQLENILKTERECKAIIKSQEDPILITDGPSDLFKILNTQYDNITNYKIFDLHEEVMKLLKVSQIMYLIGIDLAVTKQKVYIDNEFFIAVCNNSVIFMNLISKLVDKIKATSPLKESDILAGLGQKDIIKSINFISETAMTRLTNELNEGVLTFFNVKCFNDINIETIIIDVQEVYQCITKFMHFSTQKKFWSEMLRKLIINYIRFIPTSNFKDVRLFKKKIENDKENFMSSFEMIGKNMIEEITRILTLINEFLSADVQILTFSCSNIKSKFPSFNASFAKILINLRTDWSMNDKKDAEELCTDFIKTYDLKNGTNSKDEFMFKVQEDLVQEEQSIKKKEQNYNRQANNLDDICNTNKKKDFDLDEFLLQEEENDNKSELSSHIQSLKAETNLNTTDIIKEGFMEKKSASTWQSRFFQLKHFRLYWFVNEKSTMACNYISLGDLTKPPYIHKPGSFTIYNDKNQITYKFRCKDQEQLNDWLKSIKAELIRCKENSNKAIQIFSLDLKKKVILFDSIKYPHIFGYKNSIKADVLEMMNKERYFSAKVNRKKKKIGGRYHKNSIRSTGDGVELAFHDTHESCNVGVISCWDKLTRIFS